SFTRLKSMIQERRLWPPPWWRVVIRPLTFRPPVFLSGAVSERSGSDFVISSNDETVMNRLPGLVGLNFLSAISQPAFQGFPCRKWGAFSAFLDLSPREDRDLLALGDLDDRLLPALPRAPDLPAPLRLRLHLGDVHRRHLDLEELLDRLADLRLVRVRVDAERVLARLDQAVALLGDDRRDQDLAGRKAHSASSFFAPPLPARASSASSAPCETSSERAQTTAATSSSPGVTTPTWARFLKLFAIAFSSSPTTSTRGRSLPHASSTAAAFFVDGVSQAEPSMSASEPSCAWLASAARSAARETFRLTLTSKLRIVGGNATPPPVQCGTRVEPARARPVPF